MNPKISEENKKSDYSSENMELPSRFQDHEEIYRDYKKYQEWKVEMSRRMEAER